jgi:hypothetical protein
MPIRRAASFSPELARKTNSIYNVTEFLKQITQGPYPVIRFWLKPMKRGFTLILLAFATVACFAAAPAKQTKKTAAASAAKAPHKTGTQTASRATAAHAVSRPRTGSTSVVKVKYVRGRHGKLVPVATRVAAAPSYQLHPDPERYQQIQQALAGKGYFKGAVNGQWGDDSVDALKRFQLDQKLDNDGRLNALTLIGLGLGPKHDHDLSSPRPALAPSVPGNSAPKTGSTTPLTPVSTPAAPLAPPAASDQGGKP